MENLCTILVVDDDPIACSMVGRLLIQNGFEVVECRDGDSALRSLEEINQQGRYGLLLLDFEMPVLDGPAVCRRIRTHPNADIAQAPIIFITGHHEVENEVTCLDAGGDDFVSKPINFPPLLARIKTLQRVEELRRELREKNRLLEVAQKKFECDLAGAQQVQRAVISEKLLAPDGWEIAARYEPLIQVGGDAFDSLLLPDGKRLYWIADATGHGVSAALSTTLIKLLFRYAASESPAAVLKQVNRDFRGVFAGRSFFTAACFVVSPHSGLVTSAGAGHPPLALVKAGRGGIRQIYSSSPPLGLKLGRIREEQFQLKSGEGLFAYTDGLFEQGDPKAFFENTFFGPEIWKGENPLSAILRHGLQRARKERPDGAFRDDVATILLRRQ